MNTKTKTTRLTQPSNVAFFSAAKYAPTGKMTDNQFLQDVFNKLGLSEDIEEWLKKRTFYGMTVNTGNQIHELKFKKFDIRKEEESFFIHFDIKNGGCVFYDIFSYGHLWSLYKTDLQTEQNL